MNFSLFVALCMGLSQCAAQWGGPLGAMCNRIKLTSDLRRRCANGEHLNGGAFFQDPGTTLGCMCMSFFRMRGSMAGGTWTATGKKAQAMIADNVRQ